MEESTNKVVTLAALGVAINKIQQDYPTRAEVTEEIAQFSSESLIYATEEEVLALFQETVL